jgi:hypothetical protein
MQLSRTTKVIRFSYYGLDTDRAAERGTLVFSVPNANILRSTEVTGLAPMALVTRS